MYQMSATIVKVVGGEGDPPVILQVGPDKDIMDLGLPDTAMVVHGTVPTMFLMLQGGHYDLAVAEASITEKYLTNVSDGDDEEEAEESTAKVNPKTTDEKLREVEKKYVLLKEAYSESLREIKSLRQKLNKGEHGSNEFLDDSDSNEENQMAKSKSQGYKKNKSPK